MKNNLQNLSSFSSRRYDLDWLRVIAFAILIFFHVGMFFNYWGWHIKNNVVTHLVEWPMRFSHEWRMALLFMISGAGVYFALGNRKPGSFLRERFVRIFIPLLFGMFVIVPPQIFFERLTQGETYSYGEFYRTVLQFIPYPKGSFSWHHLWYLAYIFFYSLLGLPILLFIRRRPEMTAKWAKFFSNPFSFIAIPVVWHLIGNVFLDAKFPTTNNLTHDWANHFHSFTLFLSGFVLCTQIKFWDTIAKHRKLTTGIWLVLTTVLYSFFWGKRLELGEWGEILYWSLQITNSWCILLSFFGLAYVHLQFTNRFLKYANEAVYPFYILHQTVIICLAYPLINSPMPWFVKFLYLSAATFLVCLALYHFLIARLDPLRFVFGLKTKWGKKGNPNFENRIPTSSGS